MNDILNKWESYIKEKLIPIIGKNPEGNLYSKNLTNFKEKKLIPKQINLINFLSKYNPKNILEIGFNAGFSALLIKMVCPNSNLTCVDINYHNYVVPCYEIISKDYEKINLITENSYTALPKLIKKKLKYDVVHLDGDHHVISAERDFLNSLNLTNKGSVIIFDDTNLPDLNMLCEKYIINKNVKEFKFEKIKLNFYKHRFLEVLSKLTYL